MIHFERGKDPKETMEIGQIAWPLVIEDVVHATRTRHLSEDHATYSWSFDFETERSPSHCIRILLGIQECELNPDEYAVNYAEAGTGYIKTSMISDLLGTYISFRGEKYKIPTLDEFRKRQEAIRSNRNRMPNLPTGCGLG